MFARQNRRARGLAIAAVGAAIAPALAIGLTQSAHASPTPPPTITVGSNPIDIAYDHGSHTAYVANDGSVSAVDTKTNTETAEYKTGFQGQSSIAIAQGGQQLLVGTTQSRRLKVASPTQQKVVDRVRIGRGATAISVARSGNRQRAYVAQVHTNRVSILNTAHDRLVKQIHLPHGPQTATTSPDQSQVWFGSSYSGRIWVLDTKTDEVSRSISVAKAGPVSGVAFGPRGDRAWVSGLGGLDVVNVHTGKVLSYLPDHRLFPGAVKAFTLVMGDVAVSPNGHYAMVLNSTFPTSPERGGMAVIDTRTLEVTRRVKLGIEPVRFAIAGPTTYVADYADDTLSYVQTPR
jgi:DNA-binding beta-propeller fold protein YncE